MEIKAIGIIGKSYGIRGPISLFGQKEKLSLLDWKNQAFFVRETEKPKKDLFEPLTLLNQVK